MVHESLRHTVTRHAKSWLGLSFAQLWGGFRVGIANSSRLGIQQRMLKSEYAEQRSWRGSRRLLHCIALHSVPNWKPCHTTYSGFTGKTSKRNGLDVQTIVEPTAKPTRSSFPENGAEEKDGSVDADVGNSSEQVGNRTSQILARAKQAQTDGRIIFYSSEAGIPVGSGGTMYYNAAFSKLAGTPSLNFFSGCLSFDFAAFALTKCFG